MCDAARAQPTVDLLLGSARNPRVGQQHVRSAHPAVHQGADLIEFVFQLRRGERGVGLLGVLALQHERPWRNVSNATGVGRRLPGAVERTVSASVVGVGECLHRLPPYLPQDSRAQVLEGTPAQGVQGKSGRADSHDFACTAHASSLLSCSSAS
jgi:hypothetical protein